MSRPISSILCLFLCTALLWGAWRITSAPEARTDLPPLGLWPWQRARPTAAPAPAAANKPAPPKAAPREPRPAPEPMPLIRVLVREPTRSLLIEVSGSFTVKSLKDGKLLFSSGRIGPTRISASAKGFKFGKRELASSRIEIVPDTSPAVWVEATEYRGSVRIYRQASGNLAAVNVLPLEDYVASVVDSEMPAAFPDEARKAQAIVARTYALYQKQVADPAAAWDLAASTKSQKYLGYQHRDNGKLLAGESQAGRKTAEATRGEVCHYAGKLFCTYYCAVCGGSTVRGSEVFSDSAPPLVSVKCDFCREARLYRWTAEISKRDFEKEVAPWLREQGRNIGPLKSVSMSRSRGTGTGEGELELRGERESARISAAELRQLLSARGVFSPRFSVEDKGPVLFLKGRGHGHGVGLCQWGARGQALEGRTCEQILSYYYPGMSLVTRTWR